MFSGIGGAKFSKIFRNRKISALRWGNIGCTGGLEGSYHDHGRGPPPLDLSLLYFSLVRGVRSPLMVFPSLRDLRLVVSVFDEKFPQLVRPREEIRPTGSAFASECGRWVSRPPPSSFATLRRDKRLRQLRSEVSKDAQIVRRRARDWTCEK